MKMVIAGRNPASEGCEVYLIGFAPTPGAGWESPGNFGDSVKGSRCQFFERSFAAGWRKLDADLGYGYGKVHTLFGDQLGNALPLPGNWPLLLLLSHHWSGSIEFRFGFNKLALDLYSPTKRVLLVDPVSRLAIELDSSISFENGVPTIPARSALDQITEVVRGGRSILRLHGTQSAVGWLERRGYVPQGASRATIWQRKQYLLRKLPRSLGWILGWGPLKISQQKLQEDILFAMINSLISQRQVFTPATNVESLTAAGDQLRLLAAAVDGLSRWGHHRSKTP